jgi:hypothetical protein
MTYPADPGGNFASDAHRRVMANVPNPDEAGLPIEAIQRRIDLGDDYLDLEPSELEEVLKDLEADGDVEEVNTGWRNTDLGFEALTGPIAEDGGREHGA